MKSVLKKSLGRLKLAVAFAPFAAMVGGVVALVGSGIANQVNDNRINDYIDSEPASKQIQLYEQDFQDKQLLESGEILKDEYHERVSEIMNAKMPEKAEIADELLADDEEYKALKNYDRMTGNVVFAMGAVSIASVILFLADAFTNGFSLIDSAKRDFIEAKELKEEEKSKKEMEEYAEPDLVK